MENSFYFFVLMLFLFFFFGFLFWDGRFYSSSGLLSTHAHWVSLADSTVLLWFIRTLLFKETILPAAKHSRGPAKRKKSKGSWSLPSVIKLYKHRRKERWCPVFFPLMLTLKLFKCKKIVKGNKRTACITCIGENKRIRHTTYTGDCIYQSLIFQLCSM